jgi:hypothetical protein
VGRWAATQAERVAWLRMHPDIWAGWPWGWPGPASREPHRVLIQAMRDAGLYSSNTSSTDIWVHLQRLIYLAQQEG